VQTQADLLALADQVLLKNNKPQPIVFERGRGCEVWDRAGQRYLDMTAGIAVCGLGHGHSLFTARVTEQLLKLVHISNLYYNDQQILAAKAIVDRSFADRVFFCNSGAEANEGALKLARRYQAVVAGHPARTKIVSTVGSFHGRTFATVAITGQAKYRENFGPLVEPVQHIRTAISTPLRPRSIRVKRARSSSSRSRPKAASSCRRRATSRVCAGSATTPVRS
jgi:acetylornithine/succinyldiaminopimelate/putrescine aminotransferase